MHVFCGMPFNEKQTAYWKSLKFISLCFSNFWSSSKSQWRRQQQWYLIKGFKLHACFHFFAHLFAFVCKKQKFKVLRAQTFSHVISNSKRARTKFKLIGKFKMLRKLKQQKVFPARSLSCFTHFLVFVRKATRKVIIKQIMDLRRNTNI